MSVSIEYDDRPGFEHVINKITDGRNREIVFHNCKYDTAGTCADAPGTTADSYPHPTPVTPDDPIIYNRHAIATYQVDMPAFWGNESVPTTPTDKAATKAIYKLEYTLTNVRRTHFNYLESIAENGPVLQLLRLDYPSYPHRGTPSPPVDTYSIYFGYTEPPPTPPPDPPAAPVNRGELNCRTLPVLKPAVSKTCSDWKNTEVVFEYDYAYYPYGGLFFGAGGGGGTGGVTGKNSGYPTGPSIWGCPSER
jgi:hypothetical protein